MQERTELEQNLEETRQSLCGLCKSVSIETGSDQDHLQLLTKLSSTDFPIPSPGLVGKEESQITIEMLSCSRDPSGPPADLAQTAAAEAGAQTGEAGSPQGCPVPASLLNACLDMDNSL